jgi:mannosyltransferase
MKAFLKRTHRFLERTPRVDWFLLVGGLAIFAALSLWHISSASIWFDEAFSAYLIQFSYADVARYTATDVHPPLYYWLLKTWEMLFGSSEAALRSMSVLFGASAITFAFLIARRLFGRRAALLTLLFAVLSPMLIRYSQEARMYTLAATIVMAATYVLTFAVQSKKKLPWIVYGILIALGMWTHYFTALAWLAHWAWRAWTLRTKKGKVFWKQLFSKQWTWAHVLAVTLFLPWLFTMIAQLRVVQDGGFWIGPFTADTITNYFTNLFFYSNHDQISGWLALAMLFILSILGVLAYRAYRFASKSERTSYILVAALAIVPILLLILASMPPLEPSFVDRYLIPSALAFALLTGVTIALASRRVTRFVSVGVSLAVVAMMLLGIANAYNLSNFNKNSSMHIVTRQLVDAIHEKAQPGEPIVANSPWLFYEAVFYETDEHPVYFIDANTEYWYGSLDMLKYNAAHKINDIEAFERDNPVVWYIGITEDEDVVPYQEEWSKLQSLGVSSEITGKTVYRATQYEVSE